MKNLFRKSGWLLAGAMFLGCGLSASADVLFSNTTTPVGPNGTQFNPGTFEVGNQIDLTSAGWITKFSFEYYGTALFGASTFAGNVQARVRFYNNDGPLFHGFSTPNSVLFDSGWVDVAPTSASTLLFSGSDFTPGGVYVPSTELTWTVQFQGLGSGDTAGLTLYSPPTVGNEFNDYWLKNGSTWVLATNSIPVTFGAQFEGTPVPEPSALMLSVFGGLGFLMMARRFKSA